MEIKTDFIVIKVLQSDMTHPGANGPANPSLNPTFLPKLWAYSRHKLEQERMCAACRCSRCPRQSTEGTKPRTVILCFQIFQSVKTPFPLSAGDSELV